MASIKEASLEIFRRNNLYYELATITIRRQIAVKTTRKTQKAVKSSTTEKATEKKQAKESKKSSNEKKTEATTEVIVIED